ncbi:hypothetical protein BGZ76_002186 [Entomortierella beljakovae]|nr:hypothetical protein BGZ76_002186 [Entomortierella beljakovae]
MKTNIQIVSTGTEDCSPSIAINFDTKRYLINCGEGTQRLSLESTFRLSKIKSLFFTRVNWECFGGAPGMLLTLSAGESSTIKLYGGENLTHALASTRHFVYRDTMSVETTEFADNFKEIKDDDIRIKAVLAYPENFVRSTPYEWPVDGYTDNGLARFGRVPLRAVLRAKGKGNVEQESASESASVVAGSKRSSEDTQPSMSKANENSTSDQEIRKEMLSTMFNLSNEKPSSNKKIKLGRSKAGSAANSNETMTDVDMIEAARIAAMKACSTQGTNNVKTDLPRTSPNPVAISYIFQSPDYPGKFNKPAAEALGVKPGKKYSELVRGQAVTSESGETVFPHQVITGGRPGRFFMVIDCPTVEYFNSLLNAKEFEQFQTSGSEAGTSEGKTEVECIVHLNSHSIVSHPEYKAWIQRFGPKTQHIFANQDYCSQKLIWKSQSRSCYRLSSLDSTIFPHPYYNNTPEHNLDHLKDLSIKAAAAESMLSFVVEPTVGWDRTEVVPPFEKLDEEVFYEHNKLGEPDVGKAMSDKKRVEEYYEAVKQVKMGIAKESETEEDFPGSGVVLTTLGTGSSHPSKYRNVTGNLLDIPNRGTFILDAGEGSYGQMYRLFGKKTNAEDETDGVDEKIKKLKGIFVSHLHADHHLGVVTLIDKWNKLRGSNPEPLYVIAPFNFNRFLRELSDVQDFGYKNIQFIHTEDIAYWRSDHERESAVSYPITTKLLESTGFEDISTVDVIHCQWAYGISMTHSDGWKFVYSGDTRPSNNLVRAGSGATVLLHEATFEDDKLDLAKLKKHSTTGEAVMVGEGMEAKFTMLTHFSQRYPKIPFFSYEDKSTIIGVCFDMMSVKLGQIHLLPKYLPALQVLFSSQAAEAEGEDGGREDLV